MLYPSFPHSRCQDLWLIPVPYQEGARHESGRNHFIFSCISVEKQPKEGPRKDLRLLQELRMSPRCFPGCGQHFREPLVMQLKTCWDIMQK
jgi:hypothetical protein